MRFSRRRDRDPHALAGAYAVDALDDAERDQFERHMQECRSCAAEVRGFTATAAALGMAAALDPPPGLKDRVLAAAAVTRQLPPQVAEQRAEPRPQRRAARSWVPRLALAAGAAGLAAAAVTSYAAVSAQDRLNSVQSRDAAIAAVLGAADARIISAPTSAGGTATVVASVHQDAVVFTSTGLHGLPPSKVYELWFLGPGSTARRAGLVPPASGGTTAPVLASGLEPGDKVGVTVEPAGGTATPTTTPIVVVPT